MQNDQTSGQGQFAGSSRSREQATDYFSGGQPRLVTIAIGLALKPDVLIANEPTSNLEVQVIRQHARMGREMEIRYLHIEHNLRVFHDFADRVLFINPDRVVEEVPKRQIVDNLRQLPTRDTTSSLESDVEAARRRQPKETMA